MGSAPELLLYGKHLPIEHSKHEPALQRHTCSLLMVLLAVNHAVGFQRMFFVQHVLAT